MHSLLLLENPEHLHSEATHSPASLTQVFSSAEKATEHFCLRLLHSYKDIWRE